ncbi:MAG: S8 family serine peptidase, partial [Planctomycetaceae bacterium]|nr:S8 family serine peptidase [Planctomycetaceae bacterium]
MKTFHPHSQEASRRRALFRSPRILIAMAMVVAIVACLSCLSFYVSAQGETTAPGTVFGSNNRKAASVPGELLVRFRPGSAHVRTKARIVTRLELLAQGQSVSVQIERFHGSDLVEGLLLARVAPEDSALAIHALGARDDVLYVEPNFIRHAATVPNDTRYADLWALKNAGPGGAGVSAEAAWDTTTGSHSVVVGVVDSGVDTGHRDLADNVFVNPGETPNNGIDDDVNGFVDDVSGWDFVSNDRTVFDNANDDAHGTHVAGTIGARGNNGVGVVGVNWDVQIMPLKVLGPLGGSDSNLIAAFQYAKTMRQRGVNLRVLNNSYAGQGYSQSLRDAINELNSAGILFVAAAGGATTNNDFVPHYPASYELPNVISVAASDNIGGFASSVSNRGPQSIHLAAPGQGILSTTPRGYTGSGVVAAYTEADGST